MHAEAVPAGHEFEFCFYFSFLLFRMRSPGIVRHGTAAAIKGRSGFQAVRHVPEPPVLFFGADLSTVQHGLKDLYIYIYM